MFDTLYNAIDLILPFQWLSHTFMKNAFIAIIIITPLFGLLSTMVVSNKMSFFADSLGHGAFTGIAVGILLGGIDPMWGATLFSICFAIAITIIKQTRKILSIQTYYESMWIERGLNIKYQKFALPREGELVEPDIEIPLDDYRSYRRDKRSSKDTAK